MNGIVTREHRLVVEFLQELEEMRRKMKAMMRDYKPLLNGERYMTDTELAERLRLTKRTLQEYRNAGRIPFYQIGGRILYRESDIERLLQANRREAFK